VDGYDNGCVHLAIERLLSDGAYNSEPHCGVAQKNSNQYAGNNSEISHDFDPANIPLLLAE
jgi:hypothetical protein